MQRMQERVVVHDREGVNERLRFPQDVIKVRRPLPETRGAP